MGKRTILTARRAVRRLLLTNEPLITPHLRCYQHSQKPIQKNPVLNLQLQTSTVYFKSV